MIIIIIIIIIFTWRSPGWASARPRAAPRRFRVLGWPVEKEGEEELVVLAILNTKPNNIRNRFPDKPINIWGGLWRRRGRRRRRSRPCSASAGMLVES